MYMHERNPDIYGNRLFEKFRLWKVDLLLQLHIERYKRSVRSFKAKQDIKHCKRTKHVQESKWMKYVNLPWTLQSSGIELLRYNWEISNQKHLIYDGTHNKSTPTLTVENGIDIKSTIFGYFTGKIVTLQVHIKQKLDKRAS